MSHTPTSLLAARDQPSTNRTSFLCKSLKQNGDASRFAFFLRPCRTLRHPPCVTPNLLSRFDTPSLWTSMLVPLRYVNRDGRRGRNCFLFPPQRMIAAQPVADFVRLGRHCAVYLDVGNAFAGLEYLPQIFLHG